MTRLDAIDLLVRHDLIRLAVKERESLLLDWWSLDEDDPDWPTLPDDVRSEMKQTDLPRDPIDPKYDSLLRVALRHTFVGVVNSYLEKRLFAIGVPCDVEGLVEELVQCPCCGYRTLRKRGEYEICPVCFWEDDGSLEADLFSGANRMTLRSARQNFERFGAFADVARQHVQIDGRERYVRGLSPCQI